MAKPPIDQDEVDRIDEWRKAREAAERRNARRTHPGAEDSVPPARIETPWPSTPGQGSPSATIRTDPLPHFERHARWLTAGKAIVTTLVALIAALLAGGNWLIDQRVEAGIEKAKREWHVAEVAAAASAAAVSVPAQGQQIIELQKRVKRDGQRWDALDKAHHKWFQRANQPKLPKFGPKAEARGEAALPEDFDE
jgi:hypothetical protein